MACLIDHGRDWDVEIVEDQLILASKRSRASSDRAEYTALLRFAELFGDELGHQAHTYTDPRSHRPHTQVAVAGQRLRLRSAVWTTVIVISVGVVIYALPLVVGFFLDR